MADVKQVKVDNWGIYFLQRLKHFFNRTDYCDLTLQFQDNAQLKVHRLVLSACTEYFELLERTCEMYEDCLVMPDDLQADVVVPIVNFMYTGQLDFKPEFLEKLYQTSQVMNMPVLTKLLDAHRNQMQRPAPAHDYRNIKSYSKTFDTPKNVNLSAVASTSCMSTKRPYTVAFENNVIQSQSKKPTIDKPFSSRLEKVSNNNIHQSSCIESDLPSLGNKKDSRPSRYELPEELDGENVFDNSFTSISYTSTPLMVHPETIKRYSSKKTNFFDHASGTKRIGHGTSTLDIVECKKISSKESIFDDDTSVNMSDDIYSKEEQKDANQLFDQILENNNLKPTIEIKDADRSRPKLDHAKIISEVLKKYSHLVKSNKNIKLKILNTPNKSKKSKSNINVFNEEKDLKQKIDTPDFTYETDVLDSKEAAKLIALGAENIKGPWICLICGTPGRALHFTSYYKFRRHLVEVHNEKPMPKICEYCGLKSLKRNYLLHHLYTKHGVEPPPHIHFPKCNYCSYIALTEAYLVKHKMTHIENKNFGCNVCAASFNTSNQLLTHIQRTGHKYSAERKINLQCIYCLKTFSREANVYAHLKTNHKQVAQSDGIIDDSDEEKEDDKVKIGKMNKIKNTSLKYESSSNYDSEYDNLDVQYQIQQKPDGNIHVLTKTIQPSHFSKHKILNPGFNSSNKPSQNFISTGNTNKQENTRDSTMSLINNDNDGIVIIDGAEYIVKDDQLVPRIQNTTNEEFLLSNVLTEHDDNSLPTTSIEFPTIHNNSNENSKMIVKKTTHLNQPIQIVVSNEEEYKALMSANHSIIFEEGDPTKTLTVLTAPQNSALEGSTIDLDNAQSNDMMIIQDNYPLNVTQSATADNSNIVVVYSHPVDDQNKQFQYVTSQSLAAQFIQSSAMITHSFETVTTSTPVMSVNVINAPVDESWQSNIKQTGEQVPMEAQFQSQVEESNDLQSIVNPQIIPNNTQCIKDVSLLKMNPPTTATDINNIKQAVTEVTLENTNNILTNSMNQVLITKDDNMPNIDVNLTVPSEQSVHKEIQTENINDNVNQVDFIENDLAKDNIDKLLNDQQNMQKVEEIDRNISLPTQNTNLQQITIAEKENTINNINILEVPTNNMEATVTILENENNKNTEWYNENEQTTPITTASIGLSIEAIDTENSPYVEESIENIQQEIAKQMEAIATENNKMQYSDSLITNSDIGIDPMPKEEGAETAIHTYFDAPESIQTIQPNTNNVIGENQQLTCTPPKIDTTAESAPADKKDNIDIDSNQESSSDHDSIMADNNPSALIKDQNDQAKSNICEGAPEIAEGITTVNKVDENTKLSEVNNLKKQHTVITLNKTAHDKISSLLNDWDENDSQGEDSKNESHLLVDKDSIPEETVNENEEKDAPEVNESGNDNIKKLVSDWDDDDDDESK